MPEGELKGLRDGERTRDGVQDTSSAKVERRGLDETVREMGMDETMGEMGRELIVLADHYQCLFRILPTVTLETLIELQFIMGQM